MTLREDLQRIDLFAALPDEALDELIQAGTTFRLSPNSEVFHQGDPDMGFHIVRSGSATVTVNGVERGELGEGDYFGEMSLFDESGRRTATIAAGPEGVETFAVSALSMSALMDQNPQIPRALLRVLAERIRRVESAPPS